MRPESSAVNAVSWSIVAEVHMYLFYLITWPLFRRVGIWKVTAWALVLGVVYHLTMETSVADGTVSYMLSPRNFAPARFGEWLLGAAIAELVLKRPEALSRFAGPATLFAALATTSALLVACRQLGWSQYSLETLIACAAGAVVLHAVALEQRSALFRNSAFTRVSAMVGLRCYSLYLFHYPVLAIMAELAIRTVFAADPNKDVLAGSWMWGVTTMVGMCAAVVVTELTYRVVELPSHRLARSIGRRLQRRDLQEVRA
jgi:peptidoglycan/LPS O-acetylase OafA/YrhL